MLNVDTLKNDIQTALESIVPDALEQGLQSTINYKTEESDSRCKQFAKTITDILAEPLATSLAASIDYYVRSAEIYGTVMVQTSGSPTTQLAILKVDTLATGKGGGIPLAGGPNNLQLGIN